MLNCIVVQYELDARDDFHLEVLPYTKRTPEHQTPDIVLSNHHYVGLTQAHPNIYYNGVPSSLGIYVETWYIC